MTDYKDILKTCYWCGKPSTGYEHVPPQNLFPKGYRNDLITVGACHEHNEDFSKLDERLRYHMTLMGDPKIARQLYENKTLKGLNRKEGLGLNSDLKSNRFTDYNNKNWQRELSKNFNLYFEKIIRGLFYYHFGEHVSGSTSFFSNKMELVNMSADAHFYYHLLEDDLLSKWTEGNPKNKDIFDYKYYYPDAENRFLTVMTFYKEHKVIGVTLPKGKTIDDYGLDYNEYLDRRK